MAGAKGGDADSVVDDSLIEGEDNLDLDSGLDGGVDLEGEDLKDGKDAKGDDKAKKVDDDDADDGIEIVIEGQETLDQVEREGADKGAGADKDLDREDAEGGDKSDYSKKVQARIGRADRIAREATARAAAAHQGRLQAEAKSRAVQKDALEITEDALNSQIKNTKAALLQAKEAGKAAEEVDLTAELGKLSGRLDNIRRAKESLAADEEAAKRAPQDNGPNPRAAQWKERNPWYGHQRFGEQTALAQVIDKALKAEGYDPQSDQYFEELDRRVRRRLPEVVKHIRGGQPQGVRQQQQRQQQERRDPAAPAQRRDPGAADRPSRPGKIVLTKADFANMERFGIDTKDKKALKEYALNKVKGAG